MFVYTHSYLCLRFRLCRSLYACVSVCLRRSVCIHMQMSTFSQAFVAHINVGKFTAKLHHLLANCTPILAPLSPSLSLCAHSLLPVHNLRKMRFSNSHSFACQCCFIAGYCCCSCCCYCRRCCLLKLICQSIFLLIDPIVSVSNVVASLWCKAFD